MESAQTESPQLPKENEMIKRIIKALTGNNDKWCQVLLGWIAQSSMKSGLEGHVISLSTSKTS